MGGGSSAPILGKCLNKLTNFKKKRLFEKGFYFNNKIAIAGSKYGFLSANVPSCSIGREIYVYWYSCIQTDGQSYLERSLKDY